MNRAVLALALLLLLTGCRTSVARSLFSTSEVEIRVSAPHVEGDETHLDAIVIHPRGKARITEATIVVFADANGNARPDPFEWSHETVGRPDAEKDIVMTGMIYPRRERLFAEVKVIVNGGLPLVLRWAIIDVLAEGQS